MAFCKYCGKKLEDGGCDCPESQQAKAHIQNQPTQGVELTKPVQSAEPSQAAQANQPAETHAQAAQSASHNPSYAGPVPNAGQPNYQQGMPNQQGQYAGQQPGYTNPNTAQYQQQAKETFYEVKTNFVDFFKRPMTVVNNAYHSSSQSVQYVIAAVYAASIILFTMCWFQVTFDTTKKAFGIGLKLAIGALLVKFLYAVIVYFLARRYDPQVQLSRVIGVFCMVTIPETAMFVALIIITFLGIDMLFSIVLIAAFFISVIVPVIATLVVLKGNQDQTFLVSLLMQVVAVILIVFVSRAVTDSVLKDISGGMVRLDQIEDMFDEMDSVIDELGGVIGSYDSLRGYY